MVKTKKILSFAVALSLAVVSLTACGSSKDSSNTDSFASEPRITETSKTMEATTENKIITRNPDYSFTYNDFGNNENFFVRTYNQKLQSVFEEPSKTIDFEKKEGNRSYYTYWVNTYNFNVKNAFKVRLTITLDDDEKTIKRIETSIEESISNSDIFKTVSQKESSEKDDIKEICALLLPIAVFEDIKTQRKLMSHWKNFVDSIDYNSNNDNEVIKELKTDYYSLVSYTKNKGYSAFYPYNETNIVYPQKENASEGNISISADDKKRVNKALALTTFPNSSNNESMQTAINSTFKDYSLNIKLNKSDSTIGYYEYTVTATGDYYSSIQEKKSGKTSHGSISFIIMYVNDELSTCSVSVDDIWGDVYSGMAKILLGL